MFGPAWQLIDLRNTGADVEPDALRQRLAAVVAHVTEYLRHHPELIKSSGLTLDEAIATLPRPAEQDLSETLKRFPHQAESTADDETVQPLSDGNWFHNALRAAGWAH